MVCEKSCHKGGACLFSLLFLPLSVLGNHRRIHLSTGICEFVIVFEGCLAWHYSEGAVKTNGKIGIEMNSDD